MRTRHAERNRIGSPNLGISSEIHYLQCVNLWERSKTVAPCQSCPHIMQALVGLSTKGVKSSCHSVLGKTTAQVKKRFVFVRSLHGDTSRKRVASLNRRMLNQALWEKDWQATKTQILPFCNFDQCNFSTSVVTRKERVSTLSVKVTRDEKREPTTSVDEQQTSGFIAFDLCYFVPW